MCKNYAGDKMGFLQIRIYDDDVSVLCYIEEQWEADCKRIYYVVLGLSEDPVCVYYWFVYSWLQTNKLGDENIRHFLSIFINMCWLWLEIF